jgi:Ca2+-binding EF-hand superfamily protein
VAYRCIRPSQLSSPGTSESGDTLQTCGLSQPKGFLAAVAVGLAALTPCFAQGARERPRYVLQALDLDHDGTLSAQEIQAAPATLHSLDRNGDGELAPDELEPPRTDAGASPDELVTQLMHFDKNGDGVLTPDELPERMQTLFTRGDANHDGKLTPEEIRQRAAHTGSPNGARQGAGRANGMMRLDPVLNALDADHDGTISATEIANASTSLLALDANRDGTITPDEMRMHQQSPAERVDHVLGEFDTNKDGKLSRDEVPDGMRPRFAAADKNSDGFLDRDELLHMFTTQQGPGGQGDSSNAQAQPKGQHD